MACPSYQLYRHIEILGKNSPCMNAWSEGCNRENKGVDIKKGNYQLG